MQTYKIIRRNGKISPFTPLKIEKAVEKAFTAHLGEESIKSQAVKDFIANVVIKVTEKLKDRNTSGNNIFHIEDVQDRVELELSRSSTYTAVGRAYILHRAQRQQEREAESKDLIPDGVNIVTATGKKYKINGRDILQTIKESCEGLERTDPDKIFRLALREIYDGVSEKELSDAFCLASRSLIEIEPEYAFVSARLLLDTLRGEVIGHKVSQSDVSEFYPDAFKAGINNGIDAGIINPKLAKIFNINKLASALKPERDLQFRYLGLQTLVDRYLIHINDRRIELPQSFFMRVAMGLALKEDHPNDRAIEFYEILSSFRFMSSTPTLFNSGTIHSQMSSCYLTTVEDDLSAIFDAYKENALLAKFAGGLGNDWTPIRAIGSHIKGTNGKSQGVIPFLKLVNDTAVAVNQGGKRKGAVCTYLETWHMDIEEFLELRKNTGDDRRRCHDMNTANWIPDLFMKRMFDRKSWTLFSPNDVPDLHDTYGKEFKEKYEHYESLAAEGKIDHKKIQARDLWRKMLGMLFETGHPWITFKDTCNLRSPQQHCGVIHSSNLCTEITLNTSNEETAVCNLGSINLSAHIKDGGIDKEMLQTTINTAMRMLDNVIDLNFYPTKRAKTSNMRHRPVGLGMMGFQDCLYMLGMAYNSEEAITFADNSMELISYYAINASADLAKDRGKYSTYDGSLWDKGVFPLDTLEMSDWEVDTTSTLNWKALKTKVKDHGMRNSNCLAIAPTATIANIIGVTASIEPTYQNIFVKSNLSGDFTITNEFMIRDLEESGVWDDAMLQDVKYFDGKITEIDRVPAKIKRKYPTAFEVLPKWIVECAARRQKWIDQAQSLNIYMAEPSGPKLENTYHLAWRRGLKTTYYLRTLGEVSSDKNIKRSE